MNGVNSAQVKKDNSYNTAVLQCFMWHNTKAEQNKERFLIAD